MKQKILEMLEETDGFVSGQKMCETLSVSRTAVWKHVISLRRAGYKIESVTRKGYRLVEKPDLLNEQTFAANGIEKLVRGRIHLFNELDSTNEEAKRCAARGEPDGSLFVSDRQIRGKGRRGREWISPPGKDLFVSLLYRPDIPMESASMVTLVTALACALTIEKCTGARPVIKWPNDVVVGNKKVVGILTEMGVEIDHIDYLVIGIGFNLNRSNFDDTISDMATSLKKETGKSVNRAEFLAEFLKTFRPMYSVFLESLSMKPFLEDYNRRLVNRDRQIRILKKGRSVICLSKGINEQGGLMVEDEKGESMEIRSGEVSVRGLYGYV